jgi:hypothetical protein
MQAGNYNTNFNSRFIVDVDIQNNLILHKLDILDPLEKILEDTDGEEGWVDTHHYYQSKERDEKVTEMTAEAVDEV